MRIPLADLRGGYKYVVDKVREEGQTVVVRGQATYELLDVTLEIANPYDVLPVGVGRKLNLQIAALEALQLISGESHPELMVKASKNFDQFRDGGIFHGAYGPRIRAQLPAVVDRLKQDLWTRQGLIVLWDPMQDLLVPDANDYPCTIMLQFLYRDGGLQLHTTMRSNDVWWGLAYDAFQFTQLQLTVANVLHVDPGPYFHHAVSMHFYERDTEAAQRLRYPAEDDCVLVGPRGLKETHMYQAMNVAKGLLNGQSYIDRPSTSWYSQSLKRLFKPAAEEKAGTGSALAKQVFGR